MTVEATTHPVSALSGPPNSCHTCSVIAATTCSSESEANRRAASDAAKPMISHP